MVAVLVETFGGTAPIVVPSRRRRVPGREVPQQRPGPTMRPARLTRTVEVLAAVEVAVHPPHQAVQHIAGPVALGMTERDRESVALATQVQDVFLDDSTEVFRRPVSKPAQRCPKLRRSGA